MSFCKDCIPANRRGEPLGTLETTDSAACYVATTTVEYAEDKVIQLLPDAFDTNCIPVVAIDYFNGEGLPADRALNVTFNFRGWHAKQGAEVTRPSLDKLIAALKEEGVTKFGATGYCFGGLYTVNLAFENIIYTMRSILFKLAAPLLIDSCESDNLLFTAGAQARADEILDDGKLSPGYRPEYFPRCMHPPT
ncbi:hypothetical protein EDD22DRAFT_981511 [Suillus occidentalis]|nr:hypothetical protein EDD22DRAFT_981511 [Suillus occidentalis]